MSETVDPPQSWGAHIRATLRLGVPLVGSQLATIGLGVTDAVMLGRVGVEPLAAAVLGTTMVFLFTIGGTGFMQAVSPMVAAASGAGDDRTVRRAVRMGLWVGIIYAVLVMPVMWQAEAILLALGQQPDLADLGGAYVRIAQWSIVFHMIHHVLRSFLSGLERAGIVFWATFAGLILNGFLDYALIFGHWGAPRLEVAGAAWATLVTSIVIAVILVAYSHSERDVRPYQIFARLWVPDWSTFFDVFRLGWPISLTLLAEVSLFGLASIMMGWIGTVALAAHGIAMQVISVLFMVPLGLAFAATVRIGRADGRRDALGLRRASWTIGGLGVVMGIVFAVILLALPEWLIALFMDPDTPDAGAVMAYGIPLLAVAALFQLADTGQVLGAGLCRGLKDTRVPMLIAVASYAGIGIPVAYFLAFPAGWGGIGVWFGLATGLFLASVLLCWRFLMLVRARKWVGNHRPAM